MTVMKQKWPHAMLHGRPMRPITLTHDEGADSAADVRLPVEKDHLLSDRFTNQCGRSYSFIEFPALGREYFKPVRKSPEIISLQFLCNILMELVTTSLLENHFLRGIPMLLPWNFEHSISRSLFPIDFWYSKLSERTSPSVPVLWNL